MAKVERVSIPADGTKVLPKTRQRSAPPAEGRHEKFQLGTNPMKMTPFEQSRVALEVEERKMASEKYIRGIQGRDGGKCENYKRDNLTVPNNPSGF